MTSRTRCDDNNLITFLPLLVFSLFLSRFSIIFSTKSGFILALFNFNFR